MTDNDRFLKLLQLVNALKLELEIAQSDLAASKALVAKLRGHSPESRCNIAEVLLEDTSWKMVPR